MPGAITAEELARRLGVSRATVSIVLRGDAVRRKISPATTRRVLDAAREHNYVPNQAARMLRRQRTDMIGVIFPNFRLDWAERAMTGMLAVLEPTPYTPFVATHRFDPALFAKEALSSLERRDDALICHPLPDMGDVHARLASGSMPVVFMGDRPLAGRHTKGFSSVVWDAGVAARMAVRHLVELGRKRIAFLGIDYRMEMSQARVAAYHAVLNEAGLPARPQWVFVPPASSAIEKIVDPGLDQMFARGRTPPDALFVLNDGIAMPTLESLYRRGVRVPDDLAVVSMGDLPLTGHVAVGLSTMREPVERMGREAAEVALRLIADPAAGPVHRTIDCAELHARRTTIGDRWMPGSS
jgi:LacI family transcriptional regulator